MPFFFLLLEAARDPHTVRMVGKHLEHLTFRQALLDASPERRCQYLIVQSHEGGTLRIAEGEKVDKGLGKNVAVTNVEPRLAAHLVFRV
jgi:hypothetical protein